MSPDKIKKQKILIVDDSEMNRSILADILGEEYEILEAQDGLEAIDMIKRYELDISVVLLDIIMPHMNGFEVLDIMKQNHWIEDIPVIVISAENGSKQVEKAYDLGVTDFIMRPFDALIVYRRVVNTILLYSKQKRLLSMVADQIEEKEKRSTMMVDILSHIVEFRNGESNQHIIRIRTFTEVVLRQLQRMTDEFDITQAKISEISLASALHDIGKIAIDEKILNKPGRLTKEEFEVMKTHSIIGAQMLEKLPNYQETGLVRTAYEICRWHHERYDGRGYPDGLKGNDIPISAQVVALADVYDALISERCYKKAYSHETAIKMILGGECGTFSPLLMECLKTIEKKLDIEFSHLQAQEDKKLKAGVLNELLHSENKFASEHSLFLLDQERIKQSSYSIMAEEVLFEYVLGNHTLTISDWGSQKLNLDKVIVHPLQNEKMFQLIEKETFDLILNYIHTAKPNTAPFQCNCVFNMEHGKRWHRITLQTQWKENVMTGIIGKVADIHDVKMQIELLEQKASHDSATNLLNHIAAKTMILNKMKNDPMGSFALAIFDVDNFKSVNDTYGHMFGDSVLKYIADKLKNIVADEDIVARIGGDEFLIFFPYTLDINRKIEAILNSLNGTYEGLLVTVTMGVALTSVIGKEYNSLFHAADQALYSAKRLGHSQYLIYNDSMKKTLLANDKK